MSAYYLWQGWSYMQYRYLLLFLLFLPIAEAHTLYRLPLLCTGSMKPTLHCDDKVWVNVVFRKEHLLNVSDIICFNFDRRYYTYIGNTRYMCHRIIDVTPEGYFTKGDATDVVDPYLIPFSWVALKVVKIQKKQYPLNLSNGTANISSILHTPPYNRTLNKSLQVSFPYIPPISYNCKV